MSKTFSEKIDKKIDVSFSSTFFKSRFQVLLSDGSSKALKKNVLQNNRVEKILQNDPKNPKPIFPRNFYHIFGRSR
jgi:hypothetical protein